MTGELEVTRTQLIFSLGCGGVFMAAGAVLAMNGTADWGLCLVGAIITGVTAMSARLNTARESMMAAPGLQPAES